MWNTQVDTAQVENAVLNLCINARDAMEGAGKLTIEVGNAMLDDDYAHNHPDVAAGQYIMIAVSVSSLRTSTTDDRIRCRGMRTA